MNKSIYCWLFLILTPLFCNAQTYYYKLIKIKDGQEENKDVNGGQFITFTPKYCYESDNKGNTVDNGKLSLYTTENDITYYSGTAYWGDCTFAFNSSKSVLNVVTSKDVIYVYHRDEAPKGVTTSSLIKKKQKRVVLEGVLQPLFTENAIVDGNSMISSDNVVMNKSNAESTNYDYQAEYNRWVEQAKGIFRSLEASGGFHVEEKNGTTNYSINTDNSGAKQKMLNNLTNVQSEMRKTRQEAQRNGVKISPSEWETKRPSFY